MPDAERRSALEGHLVARAVDGVSQVSLSERRPQAMAMILGATDPEALGAALAHLQLTTTPESRRCAVGEGIRALWVAPGQYLVVSSRHREFELEQSLATACASMGAVTVDLSHARSVFHLEGPAAVDVLAKGCPLDLDAMVSGDTAATVLGHFNICLHRDDAGFDLYVFRSFGLACLQWLERAGAEFGMQVSVVE